MDILVTVHTYWPENNGVQYVTQYLCEGLAAKGHRITVLTTVSDPTKIGTVNHNGVRIVRAYLKTRYSFLHWGVNEFRTLFRSEVQDCDCLINCCVQSPINNVLLPLLKDVKALKVLYMHGMHSFSIPADKDFDLKYKLWHSFMSVRWSLFYNYNRRRFAQYDAVVDIHSTSSGLSYMKQLGVNAPQYIITNAVEDFDSVVVTEEDVKQNPVLKERFFLYVANFNERKNQRALIKAFKEADVYRTSKLVLIGRRSDYSEMVKHDVTTSGLGDKVLVYEDQNRSITRKFIKNCFCGIMSSQFEVYPIFLCEVISCGHPYISTDVGCVKEIPGGDIVEASSDLADAMRRMVADENHRRALCLEGLTFAKNNLSQESKIAELENLLLEGCHKKMGFVARGRDEAVS